MIDLRTLKLLRKLYVKGGQGSGNFGHSGRPGEVGGSGEGGGGGGKISGGRHSFSRLTVYQAEDMFDNVSARLTSAQIHALDRYTGSGYITINENLRAGRGAGPSAKQLDEIMNKGTVSKNIEVYRGVDEEVIGKLTVGKTFRDKGFVSTSIQKSVAKDFARYGGVFLTIHVPAGSHGYYVGQEEAELILPRGSSFTVTSVSSSGATLELKP